jgi:hypothetical protein
MDDTLAARRGSAHPSPKPDLVMVDCWTLDGPPEAVAITVLLLLLRFVGALVAVTTLQEVGREVRRWAAGRAGGADWGWGFGS